MKALASKSEQGSYEWLKERIPYITASDVHKVMARGKGVTRANYMHKMLCELLTGEPTPSFRSAYMEDGNANEHVARRIYETVTGNKVKQVGFYYLPDERIGASSDGLVGKKGGVEIKNLVATEQVKLIITKKPSSEYIKQMQTQMYVYELDWVDFVGQSLGSDEHGQLPDEYRFKIIRVMRDEKLIEEIRAECKQFFTDLDELMRKLKEA